MRFHGYLDSLKGRVCSFLAVAQAGSNKATLRPNLAILVWPLIVFFKGYRVQGQFCHLLVLYTVKRITWPLNKLASLLLWSLLLFFFQEYHYQEHFCHSLLR